MKHNFHHEASNLLNQIVANVLNDREVLRNVYKEIDIFQLTHALANIPNNLLVIGRVRVWLIVASTCHKHHFVGTMRKIKVKPSLCDKQSSAALHDFVYRFSTPGSTIFTYWL